MIRISLQEIENLRKSDLMVSYDKIIKKALKSGDGKRMRAAERLKEGMDSLFEFLKILDTCKVKQKHFMVPRQHKKLYGKCSIYLSNRRPLFFTMRQSLAKE